MSWSDDGVGCSPASRVQGLARTRVEIAQSEIAIRPDDDRLAEVPGHALVWFPFNGRAIEQVG